MSKNNARDKELMKHSETECGFNLDKFADLVRADEREACAKVVLEMKGQCWAYDHDTITAAIRARGNT